MKYSTVPFGSLLSEPIRNGLTKPKSVRGSGVKMISMGEIFAYDHIENIDMDLVPVTDKEYKNCCIKNGDLLFARQSLVLEGAGKCSVVDVVSQPTVFESHLIRVRIDPKKANPYFLYYYFKSYHGKENIKTIVEQVAAAGIRGSDLVRLSVPNPSIDLQNKIASVLKEIDDKISLNQKINDNLEQQAQLLMSQIMLQPQGQTVNLGDYLYIKGRIGWKGLKKSEYLEKSEYRIINGESLTMAGIDWDKAGFITKERYEESPEIMLQVGDILLSKDGTIGKIGYVDRLDSPTTVASGIFVIRNVKPELISTAFIYYLLKSPLFGSFIEARTEGSVIPHLYQKDFLTFEFSLPSANNMRSFDNATNPLFMQIFRNLDENRKLTSLRDTILPKLMSGEIDVEGIQL